MIAVHWKSRILALTQSLKKDEHYHAFQDIHNGLTTLKGVVERIKINHSTPFGKIDGANKIFQVKEEPAFLVVNGVVKINGVDFSHKNGVVTFNVAPPVSAIIRGFHT